LIIEIGFERSKLTVEDQILMTQVHSGHTEALGVLFEGYFRIVFKETSNEVEA